MQLTQQMSGDIKRKHFDLEHNKEWLAPNQYHD
ncbi:hypothetical protein swp_0951 [Shewanella piezotolerans WP3]|uniref:Uncharacterized protein n=1 Tax=Shewanella piezotolerans (strain WP3 / JCM 13877) TaxID=225849 RepID=B8CK53_SHEPW|nr:hypothetical protein swp_0951 [Shewanella piezotolerans WP3]